MAQVGANARTLYEQRGRYLLHPSNNNSNDCCLQRNRTITRMQISLIQIHAGGDGYVYRPGDDLDLLEVYIQKLIDYVAEERQKRIDITPLK